MAFKPLHDRVLVRRIEGEEKTKGGLIIPDTAKEKPAEGEVVSCGEGARKDSGELIPVGVKAGDRVLFGKWSGTEVTLDGKEVYLLDPDEARKLTSKPFGYTPPAKSGGPTSGVEQAPTTPAAKPSDGKPVPKKSEPSTPDVTRPDATKPGH